MAEKKNKGIRFVRIRGRVVPIKSKGATSAKMTKKSHKRKRGAALIAGGVAGAGALGYASGKLFKSAVNVGKQIQSFTGNAKLALAPGSDPKMRRAGQLLLTGAARKMPKFRSRLRLSRGLLFASGTVVAGALVGEGISKIASTFKRGDLTASQEIGSDIAGVSVAHVSSRAFKSGLGKQALLKVLSKGKL